MKLFNKSLLPGRIIFSILASLLMASVSYAQDLKIGFVSIERVLREATPAKAATAKMEQEFSRRQKELQELATRLKGMSEKLDKEAPILADSERIKRQRELADLDKDLQRKQREYREDLNQRRNEELAGVIDRTNKVIKQIADSERYDLVIQDAIIVSPRIDITDKVLKALNGK